MFYCHPPYSQGHAASQPERGMIYISVLLVERAETNFPPSISVDVENATYTYVGVGGWKSCVCGRRYRSTSRILFSFFLSPREKNKKRATWKGGPDVKRSYVYRLSARSLRRVIMMPSFSFALTDRQFSEEASSRQYYLTTLSRKSLNLYSFILFEINFFELSDFSSFYIFFPLFFKTRNSQHFCLFFLFKPTRFMFFFGLGSLLEIVLAHLVLPFFIFSSPVVRRLVNEQSDVMYRDYTLEENWMDRTTTAVIKLFRQPEKKGLLTV